MVEESERVPGDDVEGLAIAALEEFGLEGERLASLEVLRIRERKEIVRVGTDLGEVYLLRMYAPPRSRWEGRLRSRPALTSQSSWLRSLAREFGSRVPEPIAARDGSHGVTATFEGATRNCVLYRWVRGEIKPLVRLSPEESRSLGSFVARLHDHSEENPQFAGLGGPKWGWGEVLGPEARIWRHGRRVYSEEEMGVFAAVSRRVRKELRWLGERPDVYGVIHRDLRPANVVFDGEDAGAIDFENCGRGHYLYDIALMLMIVDDRVARLGRYRSRALASAFLRGYEDRRPLPFGYSNVLRTFVAMRVVDKVNTALLRAGRPDSRVDGGTLFPEALNHLRRYLETGRGPVVTCRLLWRYARDRTVGKSRSLFSGTVGSTLNISRSSEARHR